MGWAGSFLVSLLSLLAVKLWVDPEMGQVGVTAYVLALAANFLGFVEGYLRRMREARRG